MKDQANEPESPNEFLSEAEPITLKSKRKRIQPASKGLPVEDPNAYVQNKACDHTKPIRLVPGGISFKVDGAKHFYDQCRERDIESQYVIDELVIMSIRHMIYYSAAYEKFSYLNYNIQRYARNRSTVVIERVIGDLKLNALVEVHFNKINEYELTVITTMVEDSFWKHPGQFVIEIIDYDTSVLKQLIDKKLIPVSKLNLE